MSKSGRNQFGYYQRFPGERRTELRVYDSSGREMLPGAEVVLRGRTLVLEYFSRTQSKRLSGFAHLRDREGNEVRTTLAVLGWSARSPDD